MINDILKFVGKYKNFFHVLLGAIFLIVFNQLLKDLGDLYFLPVFICCAVCAFIVEWLQPIFKLGTTTAIGGTKTLIIPIIFLILESIHIIF